MRIEKYTRELVDGTYHVISGSTYCSNIYDYDQFEPIKMSLSKGDFAASTPQSRPIYNNLEDIIRAAKVKSEDSEDFAKNYAEIMRGNCPDWYLGSFDVFLGGLSLDFANRLTGEMGWVDIVGAPMLYLTFETSRTRLGFVPRYNVRIEYDGAKHRITTVEEDQGYLYRLITFKLKDTPVQSGASFPRGIPQYMEIMEYAGM